MLLLIGGCVTYTPSPVDPTGVLDALRGVSLDAVEPGQMLDQGGSDARARVFDLTDGLAAEEAAAIAIKRNPELRVQRANAGIAEAQLVEAGLLPDPGLEWTVRDDELDVVLPLLRPGERRARVGEARARIEEVRWSILTAEWELKRDVDLVFLELLAAQERFRLNRQLQLVTSRTRDFFARARELGAATALQETTAAIQAGEIRLEGERLDAETRRARLALNELLGVPPTTHYELQTSADPFAQAEDRFEDAEALTEQAVRQRPDLLELLATYERSEQRLRLAVAGQWPAWGVGTILEFALPVFSRFNRPAIRTAWQERERLRLKVEAAVHELRAEVYEDLATLELWRRQVGLFQADIGPRLEESLTLAAQAFEVRHVTAGEILIAQSQVLDARVGLLEIRIEYARALTAVTWVTGNHTTGVEP